MVLLAPAPPVLVDGSFIDDELREHLADRLRRARLKDGGETFRQGEDGGPRGVWNRKETVEIVAAHKGSWSINGYPISCHRWYKSDEEP